MGTVYVLHFLRPYKHARHYVGWTGLPLAERLQRHANGNGARLIQVIQDAGISWKLARTYEDVDQGFEKRMKKRGGASRYCPICMNTTVHGGSLDVIRQRSASL
jgi:predicted GIY-YIG superfamily endonuclease